MIRGDVKLGANVNIYHPELVNLYGCEIGDNTKIGAFVEIRKQVKIGKNCKIQAFVFIPEGVTLEDNVFVGPHVCFTNDRFPRATINERLIEENEWEVEKTVVKKGASIGVNSTVICGITIGENAMIGAGSVVNQDIAANTVVSGNPAKVMRKLGKLNNDEPTTDTPR